MKRKFKILYKNKRMLELTDKEFQECSDLFSKNYGTYSSVSPINPCEQVKMSPAYYKKHYCKKDYFVVLAYKNRSLIGQALYIRKKINKGKYITWIIQLVVKKNERGQGIAKKLMQSIWGFSNDYAWGIVTPNVYTIKTLESTTFRRCNPKEIKKNLYEIKKIAKEIDFINSDDINIDSKTSVVNTKFFVERKLDPFVDYKDDWLLGELPSGHEWLAFTFNNQPIDVEKYKKRAEEILLFSEESLKEAYTRMRVKQQSWAKHHKKELDDILKIIQLSQGNSVLDMGCGIGRHSIELAKRGYNVVGIDFSDKHINNARKKRNKYKIKNLHFYISDIRSFVTIKTYDLILCLYDVIGSFPCEKDNIEIIKKAYKFLKDGGYFILSVMNFELTDSIVPSKQKGNLKNNPSIIFKLRPSTNMMQTGDVFDPKHIAIDYKTKLVYRKEQFISTKSSFLPAEYIIRDKRYTMSEIVHILEKEGFKIIEKRYVQAGHFDKSLNNLDEKAKEILLICQK